MLVELIDKIMSQISDYVTDPMAVSNCLYIAMQDYSITRKTNVRHIAMFEA